MPTLALRQITSRRFTRGGNNGRSSWDSAGKNELPGARQVQRDLSNSASRSGCWTVGSVHTVGTHPSVTLLVVVISPG